MIFVFFHNDEDTFGEVDEIYKSKVVMGESLSKNGGEDGGDRERGLVNKKKKRSKCRVENEG